MVKGIAGLLPVSAWNFQRSVRHRQPRCGIRTARHHGGHEMRFYNQPAPILLRRRSARQEPCSPTSSTTRARPSSSRTCPPTPPPSSTPSSPSATDLVVGCECMFAWYWLADLCEDERIPFVLGHALYMKAHPRRQGQERPDRRRQARRPAPRRPVPAGLRLSQGQARRPATCCAAAASSSASAPQLIAHIVNTNSQFNLPPLPRS